MIQTLSRRRLLTLSTIGGASLLGACTVTSSGGTQTVTLDVAKIVTDGKAILAAVSAALLAPSLDALLGANYAVAQGALAAAQAALTEIETLTGGTVTLTVDTTQVQALVTSLLSDAQTVLALLQGVVGKVDSTVATAIGNSVAAALTLIPFVQMAAGFAGARPGAGSMTEAQALAVAGG